MHASRGTYRDALRGLTIIPSAFDVSFLLSVTRLFIRTEFNLFASEDLLPYHGVGKEDSCS